MTRTAADETQVLLVHRLRYRDWTLPKGKAEKLALSMTATEPLVAPVARGQHVGTVKVSLDGAAMAEFPLIALADVPAASMLGRAWDTMRLWFK